MSTILNLIASVAGVVGFEPEAIAARLERAFGHSREGQAHDSAMQAELVDFADETFRANLDDSKKKPTIRSGIVGKVKELFSSYAESEGKRKADVAFCSTFAAHRVRGTLTPAHAYVLENLDCTDEDGKPVFVAARINAVQGLMGKKKDSPFRVADETLYLTAPAGLEGVTAGEEPFALYTLAALKVIGNGGKGQSKTILDVLKGIARVETKENKSPEEKGTLYGMAARITEDAARIAKEQGETEADSRLLRLSDEIRALASVWSLEYRAALIDAETEAEFEAAQNRTAARQTAASELEAAREGRTPASTVKAS